MVMKSNNLDNIINELVDTDGYLISGDKPEYNGNSEIEVPDNQTNDEFLQAAIAPKRLYWYSSFGVPTVSNYQCDLNDNENKLVLTKEAFMKSFLPEDKFVNFSSKEVIGKKENTIKSIEQLNSTKPNLAINTKNFVEIINKTPINTNDKNIILNYIKENIEVSEN